MKSRKEVRDWIIENCVDKQGDIDLMHLDFENYRVFTNRMKANEIWQSGHRANFIEQACHEAKRIDQEAHKSEDVLEGGHQKIKKKIRFSFSEEITEEQRDAILKILRG